MKIHKVEEKKMDIHRKKEKKVRDLSRERTSSFKRIREKVRDSGASVDMARASLYTMGRKAVRDMDGGEELSDSLELMGLAAGTVYNASKGVKKAAGKYRDRKNHRDIGHHHSSSDMGTGITDKEDLVKEQKKEFRDHQDHHQGRRIAGPEKSPCKEIDRDPNGRPYANTDKLPSGQVECDFILYF